MVEFPVSPPMVTVDKELSNVQKTGDARLGDVRPEASPRAGRIATFALASVVAGLLLYLVEAVDRIAVLWPSFNSALEPAAYAAYLAPTALLTTVAAIAFAVPLTVVGLVFGGASRLAGRVSPRAGGLAAGVATVVALGVGLWTLSQIYPAVLERPLLEVARKVNLRVTSIPVVVEYFSLFYAAGLVLAVTGLLVVDRLLASRPSGKGRALLALATLVSGAALVAFYALDSRIQFGRYDLTLHLPATIVQFFLAFVTAGLALGAAGLTRARARRLVPAAVGAIALAILASAFAVWHIGSNENLKALLWRQSVVARRAYEVAALAADRDGDGATSLFAGADLDDRNPAVHPFATEIPGNGVDENCFGGDGVAPAPVRAAATATVPTDYDFILIALDTLRSSRMGVYGYSRPTTPRIAEHAARARFFPNAYAMGSNTGLTFASMQRSASRAAVFERGRPTMFATLAEAGYRTAQINASSDSRWLAPRTWRKYRKVIMNGIDEVTHQEDLGRWDADRVTDEAIAYIDALPPGTRHATWVHYLDQHEPRRKMAPFDFGDSESDIYDSTVAFTDREVGRLLDYLRDTGRLERTVVVLMADHGEAFGEHGMYEHGNRPYADQIDVPTIVWAPGVAPARVESPAATVDIAPTVLHALGLPNIPNAEGRNLLDDALPARPIFVETPANLPEPSHFSYGVIDGSWRLIWDVRGNTLELYDLSRDPHESKNLADLEPERLAAMKTLLAGWLDSTGAVRQFGKKDFKKERNDE